MLWKLILVGDVGMDMALATRMRRLWLSCQRCHRFLTAERTCSAEEAMEKLTRKPLWVSLNDRRSYEKEKEFKGFHSEVQME